MRQSGISHGDLNTSNIIIHHRNDTQDSDIDNNAVIGPDGDYDFVIVDFERSRDDWAFGREIRDPIQEFVCCDNHARSLAEWCNDNDISIVEWYVGWPGIKV